jgi:hypothetical protein
MSEQTDVYFEDDEDVSWASLSDRSQRRAALMAEINSRYFATARDRELEAGIESLIEGAVANSHGFETERRALFVIGESGAGKTRAVDRAIDKRPEFQPVETATTTTSPIIRLVAPAPCTLKMLGVELLYALGYPLERDLREGVIWGIIRRQLKERRVRFIQIDEGHHMLNWKYPINMGNLSSTLKNVMQQRDWPVRLIISGLPELASFLQTDRQMRRRSHVVHLRNLEFPKDAKLIRWVSDAAVGRTPTEFEKYVESRIVSGVNTDSLLDRMPLYASARVCEITGAVAVRGPKFRIQSLSDAELYEAGATGYEILSRGEVGLRELLTRLQEVFHKGRHDWGPKAMFGRLYEWLSHETADEAYEPIREIITRHVIETMPIGPGEELFSREVTVRRLHSVKSAALEYGLHPKRLTKMLHAEGFLSDEVMSLSPERQLFPADAAAPFLAKAATALSLRDAEEYLNAPRPAGQLLVKAGFIKPFIMGSKRGNLANHAIAREDLDDLLARLLRSAGEPQPGMVNILKAAKRCNCSTMEIVGLRLEGRISKVARDPDVHGYLSVLVDPEEIAPLVRLEDQGGLLLRVVEKRMHWSTQVVKSLVDSGLLKSRVVIHPKKRTPHKVVDESDLDDFDTRFVSLQSLAKEKGIHFRRLKQQLKDAGVMPVPCFESVPATFYSRADVERVLT